MKEFFSAYLMYADELWLTLAAGFLISGIFFKSIPTSIVEKHLGEKGLKPIFISSFVGTLLPVCCIGSLPIALTMRRKGATLGAVLAFMVATPATSVSALFVTWKLLGMTFTAYLFVSITIMALIMGIIMNREPVDQVPPEEAKQDECCRDVHHEHHEHVKKGLFRNAKEIFHYAFITLPKEIGVEILIGIALASFITVFDPLQHLIREYLIGMAGYAFIMVIGVVTYVCSTASVPMADAFLQSGLSQGQALCYLLVGPITSYGTILVIKKDFGKNVLIKYLAVICVLSLISGLLLDIIIPS